MMQHSTAPCNTHRLPTRPARERPRHQLAGWRPAVAPRWRQSRRHQVQQTAAAPRRAPPPQMQMQRQRRRCCHRCRRPYQALGSAPLVLPPQGTAAAVLPLSASGRVASGRHASSESLVVQYELARWWSSCSGNAITIYRLAIDIAARGYYMELRAVPKVNLLGSGCELLGSGCAPGLQRLSHSAAPVQLLAAQEAAGTHARRRPAADGSVGVKIMCENHLVLSSACCVHEAK